jgi:hypothetical protein
VVLIFAVPVVYVLSVVCTSKITLVTPAFMLLRVKSTIPGLPGVLLANDGMPSVLVSALNGGMGVGLELERT